MTRLGGEETQNLFELAQKTEIKSGVDLNAAIGEETRGNWRSPGKKTSAITR